MCTHMHTHKHPSDRTYTKHIQDRSNSAELLEILGGYIDNCIMPLRRMYAWGVPTSEALQAIRKHASPGLVYSMLCALNVV